MNTRGMTKTRPKLLLNVINIDYSNICEKIVNNFAFVFVTINMSYWITVFILFSTKM